MIWNENMGWNNLVYKAYDIVKYLNRWVESLNKCFREAF